MNFQVCENIQCLNAEVIVEQVNNQTRKKKRDKNPKVVISDINQLYSQDENTFYSSVIVNDLEYKIGDFAIVYNNNQESKTAIGKLIKIQRNLNGTEVHIRWFLYGNQTVLGSTADFKEIFCNMNCEYVPVYDLIQKVNVLHWKDSRNWSKLGGKYEMKSNVKIK